AQVSSDHERYPADVKCLGFLYLYVGRYPRNNASRNKQLTRNTVDLVSIILPCFNAERFVADAISSALDQSYPAVEVIAVDDGSTDSTLQVIKGFGDRIRWTSGPNRGACAARNTGLSMARGEFIQFLDADDLLHPEKISRSVAVMGNRPNTLVYSLHEIVSLAPSVPAPFQWNRRAGFEDPIAFMFQGDLPTPAPVHRKSVIEAVGGFKEGLPCAQDREFHFRMALAGVEFKSIPEVLFTIRRRDDSLGTGNMAGIHEQRGSIALDACRQLAARSRLTEHYRVECAGMLMKAARGLLRTRPEVARQFIERAYEVHPSGGIDLVYSKRAQKILRFLGAELTEKVAWYMRRANPLRK
ncbi:MAG: Glycosyl transferase family 2, partial [Candidatus Kentron sp. G]